MASPVVRSAGRPGTPPAAIRSVLVLRSCRQAQFAAAVSAARQRHPGAEIVALSHTGHVPALRAAGVDRVIEIPGTRFGVTRVSPATLRLLRAQVFEEVVIPQMSPFFGAHVNLYWLAALLRTDRMFVLPGDRAPMAFDREAFLAFARVQTIGALVALVDAPTLLVLLAWSNVCRLWRRAPQQGRKRVLCVISSLGVGGAQVQLAELLNRMPADRFDVDLLVLGQDGGFSRQWLKRSDVKVECLASWPQLSASVLEVADRCRRGRYDLVHTWLFMANVIGAAGARIAGVPLVVASVRNLSVWKREAWYRKWWHRAADVFGSHAADIVTVNAHALVDDHSRWALLPASRIQVVHNGLDPSRFLADRRDARRLLIDATGAAADAELVGTVGRLAPEKDQAAFLRLLAEVRRTRPDVHGVVVGGGELRASLEQLAQDLGIGGAVSFLGERSDARRLMAGLDLFVLTSRSEGFPNVLLEATFFGLPCVATDIAGNPDVLGSGEALFPVGDLAAGAARVVAALADRRHAAARAHVARQRALRLFTSDRSVESWLDLYRRAFARVGA